VAEFSCWCLEKPPLRVVKKDENKTLADTAKIG
jgi:hypothetical protein